jgi:hypothetical protein
LRLSLVAVVAAPQAQEEPLAVAVQAQPLLAF